MAKTFNDLVALMDRLRSPDGCPWDREQTYATLAPMLLEEAYEAFDALEEAREGRPAALREELGDLLFQITFFARVANERGEFNIDDVIEEVHAKMVRRHPHVFGDTKAGDSAEVLRNWEAINTHADSNNETDHAHVREEIGDLLFVITNIARRLNVEPEAALKLSNRKFRRRFLFIERRLRDRGREFQDTTLE